MTDERSPYRHKGPHPGGRGSQLFIIGHDAIAASSDEEIAATVDGLKQCDLYRLPYDRVTVRMLTDDVCKWRGKPIADALDRKQIVRMPDGTFKSILGPAHFIEIRNVNLLGEPIEVWLVHDGADPTYTPYELHEPQLIGGIEDANYTRTTTANLLITLLATRNAVKTTAHHKSAALGIGSKRPGSTRRYEYVTTISVPRADEMEADSEHAPTGVRRAAHLRRGHIRRQHYGPRNEMVKLKWIAPVFVNADLDYVAKRAAYNLTRPTA